MGGETMTRVSNPSTTRANRLDKYGINGIARQLSMAIIIAVLLFLGAGTLDWRWGWVYSVVYFAGWAGLSFAVARWNPELQNQRGKRARQMEGTKQWDWILLAVYSLMTVVQPFVAGLDYRNHWSSPVDSWIYVLGDLLTLIAFALLTWSMVVNRFFPPAKPPSTASEAWPNRRRSVPPAKGNCA